MEERRPFRHTFSEKKTSAQLDPKVFFKRTNSIANANANVTKPRIMKFSKS
jgi:hypothetical protein